MKEISLFKVLSEPARIEILFRLLERQQRAGDLARATGIPPSTLSFHLKMLRDEGLVRCTHVGRERWYTLGADVRRRRGNLLIHKPNIRITIHGELYGR